MGVRGSERILQLLRERTSINTVADVLIDSLALNYVMREDLLRSFPVQE